MTVFGRALRPACFFGPARPALADAGRAGLLFASTGAAKCQNTLKNRCSSMRTCSSALSISLSRSRTVSSCA